MVSVKNAKHLSKNVQENKKKHRFIEKNTNVHPEHKVKLVAQELKFVRFLAGNDSKLSEKQLVKLKKWLKIRANSSYPFEEPDFHRIWKGLFYCMWMSDKPLVQEKLSEDLASLIHCFDNPIISIQFFGTFLHTMGKKWIGIDQWRIDKFMMLIRRMTRQMIVKLCKNDYENGIIELFANEIERNVLCSNVSIGFFMHFTEILLEEVSKVTKGNILSSTIVEILRPFGTYIAKSKNMRLSKHVLKHIFHFLLFQSELGREYQEKFQAWKHMGFPGKSINEIELVNEADDEPMDIDEMNENGENSLDPRAGRVDTIMPEIKFDATDIANMLEPLISKDFTNVKSRKMLKKMVYQFNLFANGKFPIGIQRININDKETRLPSIDDKVKEFIEFENELLGKTKELKRLNKKKRKRSLVESLSDHSDAVKTNQKIKIKKSPKPKILTKEEKIQINNWIEEDVVIPKLTVNVSPIVRSEQLSTPKKTKINTDIVNSLIITESKKKKLIVNGEIPSPKEGIPKALKKDLVLNPAAIKSKKINAQKMLSAPSTPVSKQKKVKINVKLNRSQDTDDYIRQIRNSPNLPYDSTKKPSKGLLKPNLLPSPINPYYKKKIGLDI